MTSSSGPKKAGALPPSDMNRLAQRDIGKVARLFRDSGFRYRVFDSETGDHQVVDPVRPMPPMDHVPPVWPPPLSDEKSYVEVPVSRASSLVPEPEIVPEVAAPAQPAAEPAPASVPSPTVAPPPAMRSPTEAPGAQRAEAATDRIFRAAALGTAAASVATPRREPAPPVRRDPPPAAPTKPKAPLPPRASATASFAPPPLNGGNREEKPMVPKTTQASAAARSASRLVAVPGRQAQAPRAQAARAAVDPSALPSCPLRTGAGVTVGAVFRKLMEPPPPPPRREPGSTAAVLRGILEPRKDK